MKISSNGPCAKESSTWTEVQCADQTAFGWTKVNSAESDNLSKYNPSNNDETHLLLRLSSLWELRWLLQRPQSTFRAVLHVLEARFPLCGHLFQILEMPKINSILTNSVLSTNFYTLIAVTCTTLEGYVIRTTHGVAKMRLTKCSVTCHDQKKATFKIHHNSKHNFSASLEIEISKIVNTWLKWYSTVYPDSSFS
jgi:hypothetical protein